MAKKLVLFLIATLTLAITIPCVQAATWEQVNTKTFYGSAEQTMTFSAPQATTIRIQWSYVPTDSGYDWSGDYAYLGAVISGNGLVGELKESGHEITTGSELFSLNPTAQGNTGVYTIKTFPANIDSYTLTIEQDKDTLAVQPSPSIPELSTVILLVLAISSAFVAIIVKKKGLTRKS